MDQGLQQRVQKVVERRQHEREVADQFERTDLQEMRVSHDRIISEIPAALVRLSGAVEEINDAVADAKLHLTLEPVEELHTIEASFEVTLWPANDRASGLLFNVNHDGRLIALLRSAQARTRLKSVDIREADRAFFLDALISLLEAAI